jgi:hypothetical protein
VPHLALTALVGPSVSFAEHSGWWTVVLAGILRRDTCHAHQQTVVMESSGGANWQCDPEPIAELVDGVSMRQLRSAKYRDS